MPRSGVGELIATAGPERSSSYSEGDTLDFKRDDRRIGMLGSIGIIVSSILGIGVLGIPGALSGVRPFYAIILLLSMAAVNAAVAVILVSISPYPTHIHKTLESVSRALSAMASFGVFVHTLGAAISYISIATTSLKEITGIPGPLLAIFYPMLLVIVVVTWRRTPKIVSLLTLATTVSSILLLLVGISTLVINGPELTELPESGADPWKALPILSFAFYGHTSVLSVKQRYRGRKVEGIIAVSWLLVGMLYVIVYLLVPKSSALMSSVFSPSTPAGIILRIYGFVASTGGFVSYASATIDNVMEILDGIPLKTLVSYTMVLAPPLVISLFIGDVSRIFSLSGSLGAGIILLTISIAGIIKLRGIRRLVSVISLVMTVLVIGSFLISSL